MKSKHLMSLAFVLVLTRTTTCALGDSMSDGNAFYQQGKIDDAIAAFTKAIEQDPRSADAYNNRAGAEIVKQDFDAAIADSNTTSYDQQVWKPAIG